MQSLRAARVGVFAVFGLNGFLLSMWVVHIPSITDRTGVSPAVLGSLILLLAGAGVVAMQVSGPLADRFGSKLAVLIFAAFTSVTVVAPGLAGNALGLGIALVLFGFGNGALDVAMNTQAVHVERRYERPIMSSFHAFFSCGGILGALVGAATLHAGWDIRLTLGTAAAIGLVVTALAGRALLPHALPEHAAKNPGGRMPRKVLLLGAIAFAWLMAEGVANDWSTLQVKDDLAVADSAAALAFGAFSLTMTVGRFCADRLSGAFGRVAVVRYGALTAAAGMTLVIVSDSIWLTLLGWAVFGLGLAGGIPQIFSAAGNLAHGSAGVNMSRVFGMGYVGLLAGPALIGWLTELMPLTAAMCVPLLAVLLTALFANSVRT